MDSIVLFQNHFFFFFPEMFLTTALCCLLCYGVLTTTPKIPSQQVGISHLSWLSVYVLVITLLLVVNNPTLTGGFFEKMLILDPLSDFVKVAVLAGSALTLVISLPYFVAEKIESFEYPILILLATLAMLFLVSSNDLLTMYLAIELQALAFYVLATFKRNSEFSTEAGLKYFILGAFSSGLLLFGISLIYGFTGTIRLTDLAILLATSANYSAWTLAGFAIGFLFIGTSLLFKLAAVPFHMWIPDVYEGAPTSVTGFFAIVPKIVVLAVFMRLFLNSFYGLFDQWQMVIVVCSIASMAIGALGALYQTKIKRLMAYSAISHVGYMLMGVATGTSEGIQAVLAYAIIYMITTAGVFAIVLALSEKELGANPKYITDLSGLGTTNPSVALTLLVMLFSFAGIPPLAGFYGKFYLLVATIESSLYLLAIVGVVTSVMAAFYYIRIIKIVYFEPPITNTYKPIGMAQATTVALLTLLVMFFCLYPAPLFRSTHQIGCMFTTIS